MPESMSSAEANPDSNIRIADRMYGTNKALTTNFCDRPRTSSDGSSDGTSSTSGSTGAGREVVIPSFMMGMDEVLEASNASGRSTMASSLVKISTLTCSSSASASSLPRETAADHADPFRTGRRGSLPRRGGDDVCSRSCRIHRSPAVETVGEAERPR